MCNRCNVLLSWREKEVPVHVSEMEVAVKKNLKIGERVGGGGGGIFRQCPLQGPGQKQHSQKPQGFDVLRLQKGIMKAYF